MATGAASTAHIWGPMVASFAVSALKGLGGGKGKGKGEAGRQRDRLRKAFGVGEFSRRYSALYPFFLEAFEPDRVRQSDAASLGSQTEMRAVDRDATRRNLQGSGYHMGRRAGVQGGRQARVNQALLDLYSRAHSGALQEASVGQRAYGSALAGQNSGGFGLSPGQSAAQGGLSFLSNFLSQGGFGTPGGVPNSNILPGGTPRFV